MLARMDRRPGAPLVRAARMMRKREYSAPHYYEVAFDLNRKAEVDFLEDCFKRYSRHRVRRVLDIACGTGPHLFRLARRGYRMEIGRASCRERV